VKYILLMKFKIEGWETGNVTNWKPEDIKANMDFVRRFSHDLTASGEFVLTEGLGGPEHLNLVKASQDGPAAITDGPFPESKEFLAGFWIIDVESAERAYEIAATLSAIPGPGGKPANIPIEVRPLMHGCSNDQ
jgi:hypothetical protein